MEMIERISLRQFSRKYRERGLWVPRVPVCGTRVLGLTFLAVEFAMPAGLKRYYVKGHLHFITFSCYRRLPLLKSARARDVFVRELSKASDEMEFLVVGYVVMPEHVHLLIGEPKQGTPSTVMQKLKLRVACKLRKRSKFANPGQMELPFTETQEPLRSVWQWQFHQFNVYIERKSVRK